MRQQLFASAILAAVLIANPAAADGRSPARPFAFVGLWQGIDAVEGDVGLTSITPNDDGSFHVVARAEFRPCPDDEEGFATGTFFLEDGALVTRERIITCADGTVIDSSVPAVYQPDRKLDILSVFVEAEGPDHVIVLHRVSSQRLLPV